LTSTTDVPEYCQVSNKETFAVIGSPSLSSRLVSLWKYNTGLGGGAIYVLSVKT